MDAEKAAVLDVRNALFEVADGKPFGAVMRGSIMAQAKLAAQACGGEPDQTREVLAHYYAIMIEAVPIYCAEIETGDPNFQKN